MRRVFTIGLLSIALLALATPAWARGDGGPEAFVVLSGRADVLTDQRVGDLVVFHGSSTVDGTVDGSLVAFDAPVVISGRVNGDVVVFNGQVTLRSGAVVTGDVASRDAPVVVPGATIGGQTRRVETDPRWDWLGWIGRFVFWLAVSVSTLVVGLLMLWLIGRGATGIAAAGAQLGPSILWGLLVSFGLPILAIFALLTVVGIPLGFGVLTALGLIYALGYCVSAWILGRAILRKPTPWAATFLLGWAILRVVALIPILGSLVWFAAVVFGLGALVVAIWQARKGRTVAVVP